MVNMTTNLHCTHPALTLAQLGALTPAQLAGIDGGTPDWCIDDACELPRDHTAHPGRVIIETPVARPEVRAFVVVADDDPSLGPRCSVCGVLDRVVRPVGECLRHDRVAKLAVGAREAERDDESGVGVSCATCWPRPCVEPRRSMCRRTTPPAPVDDASGVSPCVYGTCKADQCGGGRCQSGTCYAYDSARAEASRTPPSGGEGRCRGCGWDRGHDRRCPYTPLAPAQGEHYCCDAPVHPHAGSVDPPAPAQGDHICAYREAGEPCPTEPGQPYGPPAPAPGEAARLAAAGLPGPQEWAREFDRMDEQGEAAVEALARVLALDNQGAAWETLLDWERDEYLATGRKIRAALDADRVPGYGPTDAGDGAGEVRVKPFLWSAIRAALKEAQEEYDFTALLVEMDSLDGTR